MHITITLLTRWGPFSFSLLTSFSNKVLPPPPPPPQPVNSSPPARHTAPRAHTSRPSRSYLVRSLPTFFFSPARPWWRRWRPVHCEHSSVVAPLAARRLAGTERENRTQESTNRVSRSRRSSRVGAMLTATATATATVGRGTRIKKRKRPERRWPSSVLPDLLCYIGDVHTAQGL